MEKKNVNDGFTVDIDPASWTTALPVISEEEDDTILTIVVVIIGIIIAIVVLCSMGIFIDCLHQDDAPPKKKSLRINVSSFSRQRHYNDERSLTSDMCPTGVDDLETNTVIVIV